jgi:autoinducer 2-degrading protein
MIVLAVKYYAKPGQAEAVAAALQRMAPLVRAQEPGCHLYQVSRLRDNSDLFLLYEQYDDMAAVDAHRATPHFKEIIQETVIPMLEKREPEFYELFIA